MKIEKKEKTLKEILNRYFAGIFTSRSVEVPFKNCIGRMGLDFQKSFNALEYMFLIRLNKEISEKN